MTFLSGPPVWVQIGLLFVITQAMRNTDYIHMYKYFRTGTTDSAPKFRDFPKPILNRNIHLVYQNCSKRLSFASMQEEFITSFIMPSLKRIKDLLLHLRQFWTYDLAQNSQAFFFLYHRIINFCPSSFEFYHTHPCNSLSFINLTPEYFSMLNASFVNVCSYSSNLTSSLSSNDLL